MIIRDPRIKPKCPQCGSENVKSALSFTNFVAWVGRILGVRMVRFMRRGARSVGVSFRCLGNSSQISGSLHSR
jgi:hypothetical protein